MNPLPVLCKNHVFFVRLLAFLTNISVSRKASTSGCKLFFSHQRQRSYALRQDCATVVLPAVTIHELKITQPRLHTS